MMMREGGDGGGGRVGGFEGKVTRCDADADVVDAGLAAGTGAGGEGEAWRAGMTRLLICWA